MALDDLISSAASPTLPAAEFADEDSITTSWDDPYLRAETIFKAWCNCFTCDELCLYEGYPLSYVRNQYQKLLEDEKLNIKKNLQLFKIGGDDSIVIVDLFPFGYNKFYEDEPIDISNTKILAMADIKNFPPKYFFKSFNNYKEETIKQEIKSTILEVVKPASTLVMDTSLFNHEDALEFKNTYKNVVTVQMLQKLNTEKQDALSNLEVIWRKVIISCQRAKDIFDVENILTAIMMKQIKVKVF